MTVNKGCMCCSSDEGMQEAGTPILASTRPRPVLGRQGSQPHALLPATHAAMVGPQRAPSTPADVIVLEDDPTPTPAREPAVVAQRKAC